MYKQLDAVFCFSRRSLWYWSVTLKTDRTALLPKVKVFTLSAVVCSRTYNSMFQFSLTETENLVYLDDKKLSMFEINHWPYVLQRLSISIEAGIHEVEQINKRKLNLTSM